MDAVKLRATTWEPLIRHKEGQVLLVPLLVLGADDPDDLPFGAHPLPRAEVDKLNARRVK
jgi:hypothetical protein